MPDYSGNSKKPEEPEIRKVTTGKVTMEKKSEGKKFLESFIEEDARNVGDYIINDILRPTLKDLIFSSITGSAEMFLFGDSGRPRKKKGGYTGYDKYYEGSSSNYVSSKRSRVRYEEDRGRHSLQNVWFEERGDAEEVLDSLLEYIEQYGRVTVASYYSACDKTPDWPDYKWGWYSLGNASVIRERRGYMIRLPKPEPVEN